MGFEIALFLKTSGVAGGYLGDDAAFDDFVSDFAAGPVTNRSV
jgi:hypothetical protein